MLSLCHHLVTVRIMPRIIYFTTEMLKIPLLTCKTFLLKTFSLSLVLQLAVQKSRLEATASNNSNMKTVQSDLLSHESDSSTRMDSRLEVSVMLLTLPQHHLFGTHLLQTQVTKQLSKFHTMTVTIGNHSLSTGKIIRLYTTVLLPFSQSSLSMVQLKSHLKQLSMERTSSVPTMLVTPCLLGLAQKSQEPQLRVNYSAQLRLKLKHQHIRSLMCYLWRFHSTVSISLALI